ncbi:YraN family protein [uncultured Ruthenibacterium sp.]|uniref:YraN family protein n=1 Tax=uncultured Ruthenibacterium sp. TaxID=1905347 RepID=UPI00349F003A
MRKDVLGAWGESMAARYYRNRGYRLLDKRYRTRFGEIDLIAEKKGMLVFIEVKTRSSNQIAQPREAVTKDKQRRIILTAQNFLQKYDFSDFLVRFDVVEVIPDAQGRAQISCFENAFSVE